MHDTKDAACRTGRTQGRKDAGQEGCRTERKRTRRTQGRKDAGQEGCRTERNRMHDWKDARKEGCRAGRMQAGGMQDRVGCRTGAMQESRNFFLACFSGAVAMKMAKALRKISLNLIKIQHVCHSEMRQISKSHSTVLFSSNKSRHFKNISD